jgi:protein N-terminal methyltransferase
MKYDLIWNQWCLGHLTDAQLVGYLKKCGRALKPAGWVVVKENMSTSDEDVFDEIDNSVTRYLSFRTTGRRSILNLANICNRLDSKFREVFEQAGLKIKRTELQKGFPKDLYPVRIYALQPVSGEAIERTFK